MENVNWTGIIIALISAFFLIKDWIVISKQKKAIRKLEADLQLVVEDNNKQRASVIEIQKESDRYFKLLNDAQRDRSRALNDNEEKKKTIEDLKYAINKETTETNKLRQSWRKADDNIKTLQSMLNNQPKVNYAKVGEGYNVDGVLMFSSGHTLAEIKKASKTYSKIAIFIAG